MSTDTHQIVALAGDWHGNTDWAQNTLAAVARLRITRVYHLGDFGIWPGPAGERYLDRIHLACRRYGLDIWVTPGNHEDWDQIDALGREGMSRIRPTIRVLQRGFRWDDGGLSFVSLGGAPSIDFEHRTEGASWWRAEMISEREAREVATEGPADVMLAHDAPDNGTDAVERIIRTPADQSPWSAAGLRYAAEGRKLMNIAFAGVRPKLFAHGHYHAVDDTDRGATRFLSLGCDGQQGNLALLRLSDLAVSWDGTWPTTPAPDLAAGQRREAGA